MSCKSASCVPANAFFSGQPLHVEQHVKRLRQGEIISNIAAQVAMGQLVSTSKKNTITEVDKAILSLKTQRRKLADYQKKVRYTIS